MKKTKKKSLILIPISIFFSLLIIELLLQLTGFKPWEYEKTEINNQKIFKHDYELGWISKQGVYELTINDSKKSKIKFQIENRGNRYTGSYNLEKDKIIFVGGSFTQGWGVNDHDTFPYLIQKKLNNFHIYNFAQSGYGGLQSLILLAREINNLQSTKLIIYGFIEHHEQRNTARSDWLKILLKYSKRGYEQIPKVPYASIDSKNELVYHKPVSYIKFPLRDKLASVVLLENFYMKQSTRHRKKNQKKVTKKIFIELNKIAKKNNSNFLIVNLNSSNADSQKEYKNFLTSHNINYVDCNLLLKKDLMVPNDFHPNAQAHFLYNECISKFIKENNLLF